MYTFIIGDDSPVYRDVFRGAIIIDCGFEVVGEAVNGEQAVELCRKHLPDVVILDVNMAPLGGDQAAEIIAAEGLAGKIVITTLARLSLAGFRAKGYGTLRKPFKREQLAGQIREVIDATR